MGSHLSLGWNPQVWPLLPGLKRELPSRLLRLLLSRPILQPLCCGLPLQLLLLQNR